MDLWLCVQPEIEGVRDGSIVQVQLGELQHMQASGDDWLPGLVMDLF